ncbi:MAG: hypothetical protein ABSB42_02400 [Tepidisphaeraceae bacterium]|jgi:hypothetical protein
MDFKSIRAGLQMSAAPRKLRGLGKSSRGDKILQDINEGREVARNQIDIPSRNFASFAPSR